MSVHSSLYPQFSPTTTEPVHLLARSGHTALCGMTTPQQSWVWPNWPQLPHAQACPECWSLRDAPATARVESEVASA
jgi:hypothetical protein